MRFCNTWKPEAVRLYSKGHKWTLSYKQINNIEAKQRERQTKTLLTRKQIKYVTLMKNSGSFDIHQGAITYFLTCSERSKFKMNLLILFLQKYKQNKKSLSMISACIIGSLNKSESQGCIWDENQTHNTMNVSLPKFRSTVQLQIPSVLTSSQLS